MQRLRIRVHCATRRPLGGVFIVAISVLACISCETGNTGRSCPTRPEGVNSSGSAPREDGECRTALRQLASEQMDEVRSAFRFFLSRNCEEDLTSACKSDTKALARRAKIILRLRSAHLRRLLLECRLAGGPSGLYALDFPSMDFLRILQASQVSIAPKQNVGCGLCPEPSLLDLESRRQEKLELPRHIAWNEPPLWSLDGNRLCFVEVDEDRIPTGCVTQYDVKLQVANSWKVAKYGDQSLRLGGIQGGPNEALWIARTNSLTQARTELGLASQGIAFVQIQVKDCISFCIPTSQECLQAAVLSRADNSIDISIVDEACSTIGKCSTDFVRADAGMWDRESSTAVIVGENASGAKGVSFVDLEKHAATFATIPLPEHVISLAVDTGMRIAVLVTIDVKGICRTYLVSSTDSEALAVEFLPDEIARCFVGP
ncbi:MAG: hypothetical protein FD180_3144 [Planctomycetota bacterium]|nr:MAG: hypothetical protein FD180_3144 [Planctomycetota bacterium]